MSRQRRTLINTATGEYAADASVDATTLGLPVSEWPWSVRLKRLRGGPSDGVDVVDLDNGHLQLSILPTRGMGIWKGRCGEIPLQWDSPVAHPVHPSLVDPSRRGGIGWLDGFNELMCRCGLAWNGAPGTDTIRDGSGHVVSEEFLPLHGRIANCPAHEVRVDATESGEISVTGVVDETSMFGERLRLISTLTTTVGSAEFEMVDTVVNLGARPAEVELLYHCNFGAPLLSEGATVHAAARRVVPRDVRSTEDVDSWDLFRGPTAGYVEQVYFVEPLKDSSGWAHAVLRSADGSAAAGIDFRAGTLPWLTIWKCTQEESRGYVCGLEPGSDLPNNRSFERQQGRTCTLAHNEIAEFAFRVRIAETPEQTRALIRDVDALQGTRSCIVESAPDPKLAPG